MMDRGGATTSRCPKCAREATPGGGFCAFCGAPLSGVEEETRPIPRTPGSPPQLVAGRFEILRELGRGGFGIVYEARDRVLSRTVAIKTIRTEGFSSPAEREAFEKRLVREARAVAGLAHPNIVALHDAGDHEGTPFLAMEYVPGRNLRAILSEQGRLPHDEAMRIAGGVLAALGHAHRSSILHRDVKPENVLVRDDGLVKVADFGVAKALHLDTPTLTKAGSVLGTPSYMSPEQIQGRELDGRSDVFSAAALLYELLTGRRPFQAESVPTLVYKILNETPESPARIEPSIPAHVSAAVMQGLEKDPAGRPASCDAFLARLRGDVPTVALDARAPTAGSPTPRDAGPTLAVAAEGSQPAGEGRASGREPASRGVLRVLAVALLGLAVILAVRVLSPDDGPREPVRASRDPQIEELTKTVKELAERDAARDRELQTLRGRTPELPAATPASLPPGDASGRGDAEAIASLLEEAGRAFDERDAERLLRLYAHDARLVLLAGTLLRADVAGLYQTRMSGEEEPASIAFFEPYPCCEQLGARDAVVQVKARHGDPFSEAMLRLEKAGSRWTIGELEEMQPEATTLGRPIAELVSRLCFNLQLANVPALVELFADDAELVDDGAPLQGKDAIRAFYTERLRPSKSQLRHDLGSLRIREEGGYAACITLWDMDGRPPRESRYVVELARSDEHLLISRLVRGPC